MLESLLSFSRAFSVNVFDLLNADYDLVVALMKVGTKILEEEKREMERVSREPKYMGAPESRVLTDEVQIISFLRAEEGKKAA